MRAEQKSRLQFWKRQGKPFFSHIWRKTFSAFVLASPSVHASIIALFPSFSRRRSGWKKYCAPHRKVTPFLGYAVFVRADKRLLAGHNVQSQSQGKLLTAGLATSLLPLVPHEAQPKLTVAT